MFKSYSMELGGRTLTLEFGKYAEQASGSCFVRYGDTCVLTTCTVAKTPRPGIDFFPLSVDFEEKLYSVGHIPGSWNRREGRPAEKAILTSRLIDRPLRPLFPKGMRHDVSVVATVMSVDTNNIPDIPAMIGASASLAVSEIPWAGPIGAVNIGYVDGEYIVNPNDEQREESLLNLTVAGTSEAVLMVEAGAKEVSEEVMLGGILFAHEEIKKIVALINTIVAEIGKEKKEFPLVLPGEDVKAAVREYAMDKVKWMFETFDRSERNAREEQVKAEVAEHFAEQFEGREVEVGDALYGLQKEVMRRHIIDEGVRPDGRKLTEVRPIWCEVGVLPRPHGSAVFTRGQTQVMTVATLAPVSEKQIIDGIGTEDSKRYMHHYNFPGYSTGEAKPIRSPGRREIGHGALAERALLPMIPPVEEFPYCLRLVSEVMSSNGSTSQASVCGSTLALMDAGVPIKRPVAGVAMGLIKDVENTGKVAVLTDIQGLEDFLGDMDFKVAGTAQGITAIQMDIKIKGIDEAILRQALAQAHDGRMHILDKMLDALPAPRPHLSRYAPKIIHFFINPEKIGEVVGPRGKMINKIIEETGVKIDIEDDGSVFIATTDDAAAQKARSIIEGIVRELKVGDVFTGKVARIMSFGAFVEYAPGKDGMIHISKLANGRVDKVEDVVKIGDELECKVAEIDSQGRINLIRNDIQYDDESMPVRRPPRRDGDRGGRDRGGRPPRR
ncbi:MAG TPA: polyribonucleotide nucleotidyltransferase [Candidatus Pullichristensenella excrementipullorum]|nr:polyribonucleotide nucleotidyltransferase [Candidatus Pullichristensenella excrementipullorum]